MTDLVLAVGRVLAVGGALFEGLAGTPAEAREAIDAGEITVEPAGKYSGPKEDRK